MFKVETLIEKLQKLDKDSIVEFAVLDRAENKAKVYSYSITKENKNKIYKFQISLQDKFEISEIL